MAIHPTALIDPSAELGKDVSVGAYSIIGPGVVLGDDTRVGPHVLVEANTTIGRDSSLFKGACVGIMPQDIRYQGDQTTLAIGERAVLREYCTISRGSEGSTVIGDDFLLMCYGHVSHDCRIGSGVVLSNSVIVMGRAVIGDNVIVGSLTFINRFVRIGELAFVGGGFRAVKDIPPYCIAADEPLQITGVNTVALEKKGFPPDRIEAISQAYQALRAGSENTAAAIDKLRPDAGGEVLKILDFIEESERGVIV